MTDSDSSYNRYNSLSYLTPNNLRFSLELNDEIIEFLFFVLVDGTLLKVIYIVKIVLFYFLELAVQNKMPKHNLPFISSITLLSLWELS